MRAHRRVEEYSVSCVPEGYDVASLFTVHVVRTGRGWRVSVRGGDYDAHGQRSAGLWWPDREHDREPLPEEREAYEKAYDAWIQAHRFEEEAALRLADFVAEHMMYRGRTAVEMMAEEDELRRLDADQ